MTGYHLEWLIKLKKQHEFVDFIGQDYKTNPTVGDAVPVSICIRVNKKDVISAGEYYEMWYFIDVDVLIHA